MILWACNIAGLDEEVRRVEQMRPLVIADAEEVARVVRDAFAGRVADPPPSALRETTASVAAKLAAGGGAGVVQAGALVAVVLWGEQGGALYLGRLAVLPEWRRHGFARRLIVAGEAEARRLRLPRVQVSTRLVWADNRRLFATCGYRETTQHAHPGYAEPTFVDLEKTLLYA